MNTLNGLSESDYRELIDLVEKRDSRSKVLETLRAQKTLTKREADFLIGLYKEESVGVLTEISSHDKYPSGANRKAAKDMKQV
jgi:hypothetical protein